MDLFSVMIHGPEKTPYEGMILWSNFFVILLKDQKVPMKIFDQNKAQGLNT